MRHRHNILSLLTLALLLQGCEHGFDIDVSADAKLFLQCFPGGRDTTVIQLYRTNPLGSVYDVSSLLDCAEVSFRVDGEERPVQKTGEWLGSVFPGCWFVPGDVGSGSTVEISAVYDGLEPITAKTTVPAPVPEFEYTLEKDAVSVSIKGKPEDDTYYGLAVLCERTVDKDGMHDVQVVNMNPYDDAGEIAGMSYSRTYMDIEFDGRTIGGLVGRGAMRLWSDDASEGGKTELAMRFYLDRLKLREYGGEYQEKMRYRVRVYRFSRELFLYAESLFLSSYVIHQSTSGGVPAPEAGSWGKYGITPPVLSFNNVSGGLGVLAGWTMRDTDWVILE